MRGHRYIAVGGVRGHRYRAVGGLRGEGSTGT